MFMKGLLRQVGMNDYWNSYQNIVTKGINFDNDKI